MQDSNGEANLSITNVWGGGGGGGLSSCRVPGVHSPSWGV
jgi:hypothetical protein